jgi:shikimate dehydrogenase
MTDRYAVIGNPLSHTKSPMIHSAFARGQQQDMAYTAIEAPRDGFEAAVERFRAEGGRGMNVTAPFKLAAFAMGTHQSPRARLAGAANAMKFEGDRIHVENFDGVGLVNDIQNNLGFSIQGRRVLLLGAGGAARGAILPILEARPAQLTVANRSVQKAAGLKHQFPTHPELDAGGYDDLAGREFDIILNATSASLHGDLPPLPATVFASGCLAYELVYGKGLTPFLRLAQESGAARLADGVGMLVEQAAEAFFWWRGVRPETRKMIDAITVPLA